MQKPQPLPGLRVDQLMKAMRSLELMDKQTAARIPWRPTPAQRRLALAQKSSRRLLVGKPRQIKASTLFLLVDLLWVYFMGLRGNPVPCAIVIDSDDKAKEMILRIADFAEQLNIPLASSTSHGLDLANGGRIRAFTGGGIQAGASKSFGRVHITELPFIKQGKPGEFLGSFMPTVGKYCWAVIETTMEAADDGTCSNLWHGSDWDRVFFSVEDEPEYRDDPETIDMDGGPVLTKEREKFLRSEGFTDPAAMVWWLRTCRNDFGGMEADCFRKYPQLPAHMFRFSEGAWYTLHPDFRAPLRTVEVQGKSESWVLSIFIEPTKGSGQYSIGLDTAGANGRDRSSIAVVDKETGQLMASFVSDWVYADDLAAIAKVAQDEYTTGGKVAFKAIHHHTPQYVPTVYIEKNGIGEATVQAARRIGVILRAVTARDDVTYRALLSAKRAVEAGIIHGPKELTEECKRLRWDNGKWKGHKDLSVAIGTALMAGEKDPYVPPPKERRDRNVVDIQAMLDRAAARRGY